jgi:hypothetical protein
LKRWKEEVTAMPTHKPQKFSNRLTEEQKRQWAIDGYLVLKGVLSRPEIDRLIREVDRLHRKHVLQNKDADRKKGIDRRNVMEDSDAFVGLIDHPATFGVVLDLIGPYIQLSMSEVIVRPPNPDFKGYIHTDGGQAMRHIRVTETSWPLQLKIQYFLTDVRKPHSGNFTLFPGSHLRPYPEGEAPITVETPGAVQLCVEAGDAAVFPHSLWHGVSPNLSPRPRKTLIYCYSQMCFRAFDFEKPTPELLERCTPRQRRLLGDLGYAWKPGSYFYSPQDQVELMNNGVAKAVKKAEKVKR